MLEELREARAHIARGWTQNAYWRDNAGNTLFLDWNGHAEVASCCTLGAIKLATYGTDPQCERDLIDFLWTHLPPNDTFEGRSLQEDISVWNDDPDRAKEEVLALFDEAIWEVNPSC